MTQPVTAILPEAQMSTVVERERMCVLAIDRDARRFSQLLAAFARTTDIDSVHSVDPEDEWATGEGSPPAEIALISAATCDDAEIERILRRLRTAQPWIRVLVMDVPDESRSVIRYLEAGAWGYAFAQDGVEWLIRNVHAACRRETLVSNEVGGQVITRLHELARWQTSQARAGWGFDAGLTPRQQEILSMISRRMTNREIARALILEVGTVKNHVHRVMRKLQAKNRYQAASASVFVQRPEIVAEVDGPRAG